MQSTGIIKRLDNSGKIQIPVEIHKSLKIKEGDSLEIFIDKNNQEILFKKSNEDESILNKCKEMVKLLHQSTGFDIIFSDCWEVLWSSNDFLTGNQISFDNSFTDDLCTLHEFKIGENQSTKGNCYTINIDNEPNFYIIVISDDTKKIKKCHKMITGIISLIQYAIN